MTKIIHNFWINTEPSEIDCRGAIYLTKCNAKYMRVENFEEDMKFIDTLRKNKKDNIGSNILNISGGNASLYEHYKKKYLLNKNMKDKELYKFFKKNSD